MENEEFAGKDNSSNKMLLEMFSRSREQTTTRHPLHRNEDDQIARYKCVDVERDHSARRVYWNCRTARDVLIVNNSP